MLTTLYCLEDLETKELMFTFISSFEEQNVRLHHYSRWYYETTLRFWFQIGQRLLPSRPASIAICTMLQEWSRMRSIHKCILVGFSNSLLKNSFQLYIACFEKSYLAVLDMITLQFRRENVLSSIIQIKAPGMMAIGQGFDTKNESSLSSDIILSCHVFKFLSFHGISWESGVGYVLWNGEARWHNGYHKERQERGLVWNHPHPLACLSSFSTTCQCWDPWWFSKLLNKVWSSKIYTRSRPCHLSFNRPQRLLS